MKNKSYNYENVQIGNFLISIGYYLKEFEYKHPVSINLHQQTPNDFTIGDLFGAFSGKFFIIEFKNSKENLKEELKKLQRKKLLDGLKNDSNVREISVKGHFICYPDFLNQVIEFKLSPYICIQNKTSEYLKINNTKNFLLKLLNEKSVGVGFKEIKEYLDLLKKLSTEEGNTSSEGASSGIIINCNNEGEINYHIFDDLNSLNHKLKLKKSINRSIEESENKSRKRGISR